MCVWGDTIPRSRVYGVELNEMETSRLHENVARSKLKGKRDLEGLKSCLAINENSGH